jgi:tetratricopeptide (TPR) repeat protein
MLRQFNRFIVLALIVGLALYITLTNSESATIKLGPNITLTTYAGVIYIGVFVLGCIAASLVALFFGFKGYLRERRLRAAERSRRNFFKIFEEARNLMAGGNWAAARLLWEEILGREPDNVIARVELSHCLEQAGDDREALRVLDATRASSKSSVEVLYRAAMLNQKLGNSTGARDNADLIVSDKPSWKALEIARDASEAMGRFDEALRYHDELEKIGYQSPESKNVRARLVYAQVCSDTSDEGKLKEALVGFVKQYPQFLPALERLAELEVKHKDIDRAADLLAKVARSCGNSVARWQAVVDLWLSRASGDMARRTDKAIAAAKSALKDQHGRARLEAELLVIRTLLAVNHFQDAERLLDGFTDLATREVGTLPADLSRELLVQRGHCLAQMGNARDTAPLWQALAASGVTAVAASKGMISSAQVAAEPSPILSTP